MRRVRQLSLGDGLPLSRRRSGHIIAPMTSASAAAAFLDYLRRSRNGAVWLFVTLVLLVSAERRVAELHFNLRTAGAALENEDSLDADEIRTRLIVLNDDKVPTLPAVSKHVSAVVTRCWARPVLYALGSPAPRGPPVPRFFLA